MLDVAVFAVDCRVAPVAEEGVLAFLTQRASLSALSTSLGLLAFTSTLPGRAALGMMVVSTTAPRAPCTRPVAPTGY